MKKPIVPAPLPRLTDVHALVIGGTRRGKSVLAELLARGIITSWPLAGAFTAIDPHGSFVRALRDYMANPVSAAVDATVHYLDPSLGAYVPINPLEPYADTPEGWHDAAVTLSAAIEARFGAAAEETPRLARIVYVAAYICARHGLTILEVLELLTIGGESLRVTLLADFENHVVRRELEDLHELATRSPREFLIMVESCKNRLVRWLGDRRLQRILGQRRGLSPRAVMDGGEFVLADLSSLTYADAALVGTIMSSMYIAAARRRPPLQGAPHRLIIDEAESMITVDTARGADQVAKNRLFLLLIIQRLGQLLARGDFIADALFVNCAVKIVFGGLDPVSAKFMAEMLFAGHFDLEEWKEGSARPTVVGLDKVTLRGRSRGTHRMEGRGIGEGSVYSRASFSAATDTFMSSWGSVISGGNSSSMMITPADTLVTSSISDASASSRGRGRARGRAAGTQVGEANVTTTSRMQGIGESDSVSESEAYVARYENLPTQMYSLEEQIARRAWELMELPRRHCIIRVESDAPFRTITRDLEPSFRSVTFRDQCVPLFTAKLLSSSRYIRPVTDIDREIAERLADLTRSTIDDSPVGAPEPDPRVVPLSPRPRPPFRRSE